MLISRLLLCMLIISVPAWAAEVGPALNEPSREHDSCQGPFHTGAIQLRQALDFRLMQDFPADAQLDEGYARLSPFSIRAIDCERQRMVVSGTYEFRGNFGVMDVTRRGTIVLELQLAARLGQERVFLEKPQVTDITFDNPAPWFDAKAIGNWALTLFGTRMCAQLQNGLPC